MKADQKGFTEHRFDYSRGSMLAPELTIMVGVSGSGKSTIARSWVNWGRGQVIRLNRDEMRLSMYVEVPWSAHHDEVIRVVQKESARIALKQGKSVIIDDTNCVRKTRQGWEELAKATGSKFRLVVMTTPLKECIERDAARASLLQNVGEKVIRDQFEKLSASAVKVKDIEAVNTRPYFEREQLRYGGFTLRLPDAKIVLVDMDGTVANHKGKRAPYDESKVLLDDPYTVVCDWVRAIYPHYNVFIVSGRKDKCGDDSCEWLEGHNVPFDHILMRPTKDGRPDRVIKQEILEEIIAVFSKDKIAFVLDDRPSVVKFWKAQGLTVYPVRGGVQHSLGCFNGPFPVYDHNVCTGCGALEDF